jgi:hypothetical protein
MAAGCTKPAAIATLRVAAPTPVTRAVTTAPPAVLHASSVLNQSGNAIVAQGAGNAVGTSGAASLIGNDGGSAISTAGSSLAAPSAAGAASSPAGAGLIGNDGGSLIGNDGGGLIATEPNLPTAPVVVTEPGPADTSSQDTTPGRTRNTLTPGTPEVPAAEASPEPTPTPTPGLAVER